ncbi:hypothetical protein P9112_004266 [Eukaryota sp. TZLM1-RC]
MQHSAMTKNTNGSFFDDSVLTDGFGVSVQHKRNDLKKCKDKQKESDELYNHDLCADELNSLKGEVIAGIDPNEYDTKLVSVSETPIPTEIPHQISQSHTAGMSNTESKGINMTEADRKKLEKKMI